MIVQAKPRIPIDAPVRSYPKVRQVWHLLEENSLFFHDEKGVSQKISLENHEVQVIEEQK